VNNQTTTKQNDIIPASSNDGRCCAEEDLTLLPCGCREFPRAIMPSSTEAVVLDVSASNCRCLVLSYEPRTLAACSGKCSANAPNALHSCSTHDCILDSIWMQYYTTWYKNMLHNIFCNWTIATIFITSHLFN